MVKEYEEGGLKAIDIEYINETIKIISKTWKKVLVSYAQWNFY